MNRYCWYLMSVASASVGIAAYIAGRPWGIATFGLGLLVMLGIIALHEN